MKTNPIYRRAVLVAALFMGAGCLALAGDAPAAAASKGDAAKPAIEKGMSADEIRKLLGKPKSVKRIEKDDLKAESWTYRRKIRTVTTQAVVGDESQPAFVGLGMGDANGLGTVSVPVYRLKHTTYYQMTALLMVEGELVTARQWVEEEVSYEG